MNYNVFKLGVRTAISGELMVVGMWDTTPPKFQSKYATDRIIPDHEYTCEDTENLDLDYIETGNLVWNEKYQNPF